MGGRLDLGANVQDVRVRLGVAVGVEAAQQSASAVAKGTQAAIVEITDFSKESFERGASAAEKLMSVRSLDKAVEVQTEFVRDAYESMMGRMTKIGEIYSASMRDAYKPFEAVAEQTTSFGKAA